VSTVTPVCFGAPLAPLAASEIEKKSVRFGSINKAFRTLSARYDAMVMEGIGGLMVPIKKGYFAADLAAGFGLPVIVVCRPGLGTINHTLLTVDYALRRGLTVAGIIINHPVRAQKNLAERTNPGLLSRIAPVPVIGAFPHLKDLREETIKKAALKSLDAGILRKYLRRTG